MSDNITGFGNGSDEINLGLNINSNVGSSVNDFNTLDQVLQQMIKDQETFNGIQDDSFEKAKSTTQELRGSSEQAQQLISIFRALRGEQQGILQDAKQFAAVYQQINNELQKAAQSKTRLGITSPGVGIPGSTSGVPSSSPTTSVPPTQTAGGGGMGGAPPGSIPTAGYPQDPDDFFGREEDKSGASRSRSNARKSSGGGPTDIDIGSGPDLTSDDDVDWLNNSTAFPNSGSSTGSRGRRRTNAVNMGRVSNEQYKTVSDLSLALFPRAGYYRNLRRARWLTRNEGKTIGKFINSKAGKRVGLAFNRLGGGLRLRTEEGYQLFPFSQNENGDYVSDTDNGVVVGPGDGPQMYGLQDANGKFLPQGGEGLELPPWAWSGEGPMPPMPPPSTNPQQFNPWNRPNLSATGTGVAKVAGAMYAARVAKSKASNLFQEGQLYTGLTGGTGVAGALGYDLGAQATSWFGLNPLESYGQAKQITMQNLALGYRGNLLNRANEFGNTALQKYGVDPQTSMQMFGQMVMQAGVSLQDLQESLAELAKTSSTTNTSFSMLQQSLVQYSQLGGNIGLTGGENATFATAASQFAAGQPGLQATGSNPADILDSMVGQSLVAQQMGTSYLGLPQAASQQGDMALTRAYIHVDASLLNRIGLNQSNYKNKTALRNAYFKFKLLMHALGRTKEANDSMKNYELYVRRIFDGSAQKKMTQTINRQFGHDISGATGGSPAEALAKGSSDPSIGSLENGGLSPMLHDLLSIRGQKHWKDIGISHDGKFTSINDIRKMPAAQQDMIMAAIGTGHLPISHITQNGKMVQGNYQSGTLLDLQGHSVDQRNEFGQTPNTAKMLKAQEKAIQIELGPHAAKYLRMLEHPAEFNRYLTKWTKTIAAPPTSWGNPPSSNG